MPEDAGDVINFIKLIKNIVTSAKNVGFQEF
jgi:hypothetical protein